jgi:uncharacterized protein (TIRG00374 family)
MKSKIITALKLILPLGFGVFLIWLFYDALCEDDKADLFSAFGRANYFWVFLALIFSFLSHVSRAMRWKYLLQPLGFKVNFWNSYHALMIGYIVNFVFPRAGEASRAGILAKSEKVPFQKGFGTILAERAVDVGMLGIICLIGLGMQFDKIDAFRSKIASFNSGEAGCGNSVIFSILGKVVTYGLLLGVLTAVVLVIAKKSFREKIKTFVFGLWEGILSIFKTDGKIQFIAHTFFIWIMYVLMFSVCFYSLETTAELGIDAMLAGFIAGTIGIILVQGGIGVYPAFVGLIITTYLAPNEPGILPDALALGWIIWTSQTLLMIILGLISLAINSRNVKFKENELAKED